MNTEISLMYRDASNYKKSVQVIVAGTPTADWRAPLDAGLYLVVPQVNDHLGGQLPDPRDAMLAEYSEGDDDHCWVEVDSVTPTEAEPTTDVTIDDFIAACTAAAAEGWNDVDAYG